MAPLDSLLKGYKEPVEPRPSCIERLVIRRQLTALMPGYWNTFTLPDCTQVKITRTQHWDEYRYRIERVEITLDEAIDVVLGKSEWRTYYTAGIERAKPPREFASVIDRSAPVATVQVPLFSLGAA